MKGKTSDEWWEVVKVAGICFATTIFTVMLVNPQTNQGNPQEIVLEGTAHFTFANGMKITVPAGTYTH